MIKIVAIALIVFFCASSALSAEPPQIAFKLLTGYVEENDSAKGINGTAIGVIAAGLCLLGGATILWLGGDSIASSLGYGYIPSSIRDSIAMSFAAASVLFFTPSKEELLLSQYLEAKAEIERTGIAPAN
jgi:hypothetical protein